MDFVTKDTLAWFTDFLVYGRKDFFIDAEMWDTIDKLNDSHLLKGPLNVLFSHCGFFDDILHSKALTFMSSNVIDQALRPP